jgi:hypothetical protein
MAVDTEKSKENIGEEDDFIFGNDKNKSDSTKTDSDNKDQSEEKEDDDKASDIKNGKSDTRDDDGKSAENKSGDENKDDEESSDSKYNKEAGKKDKNENDQEDDIFSDLKEETKRNGSLKELGKKFDITLEKDDESEFETKMNEKISKARQEVNLDGFSPDAKVLIKHLNENGGDVESFFTNKNIISLQSVLSLDAETKVRNVRIGEIQESGKSKTEAQQILDQEMKGMSTRELKDMADDIDIQAKKLIQTEVKKIVGDRESKISEENARLEATAKKERNDLISYIEKQDNFLGLKLTAEAKKTFIKDINNGEFDKILKTNPHEKKFSTYMMGKFGDKITKKLNSMISESNREGFNKATQKQLDALHKTEDEASKKNTGHNEAKRTSVSSKVSFKSDDID